MDYNGASKKTLWHPFAGKKTLYAPVVPDRGHRGPALYRLSRLRCHLPPGRMGERRIPQQTERCRVQVLFPVPHVLEHLQRGRRHSDPRPVPRHLRRFAGPAHPVALPDRAAAREGQRQVFGHHPGGIPLELRPLRHPDGGERVRRGGRRPGRHARGGGRARSDSKSPSASSPGSRRRSPSSASAARCISAR